MKNEAQAKTSASDVEELVVGDVGDVGDVEDSNGLRFRKASSGSDANREAMVRSKVQKLRTDAEEDADRAEEEGKKRLEHNEHEPQRGLREETQ